MWWFLGILAALQLYFVRELIAAFALFTAAFAALVMMAFAAYMIRTGWEFALARFVHTGQRAVNVALSAKATQKAS